LKAVIPEFQNFLTAIKHSIFTRVNSFNSIDYLVMSNFCFLREALVKLNSQDYEYFLDQHFKYIPFLKSLIIIKLNFNLNLTAWFLGYKPYHALSEAIHHIWPSILRISSYCHQRPWKDQKTSIWVWLTHFYFGFNSVI